MKKEQPIWLWEFKRQMDLLRIYSFANSYYKIIGRFFYWSENYETNFYRDKITAEQESGKILKNILRSSIFVDQQFIEKQKMVVVFDKLILKFKKTNFSKLSDRALFDYYLNFQKTLQYGGRAPVFIRILIIVGEPFFKEKLKEKFEDDYLDVFTALTTPAEISFTQEEEINLLKIGLLILRNNLAINSTIVLQKINNHLKKFAYLPCGYYDEPPYEVVDIEKRLKKILELTEGQILQKLKHLTDKKSLKLEQKKYLKKIFLDKSLQNLAKALRLSVFYKEKIRGKFNESAYYSTSLFAEISKRTKLTTRECKMLLPMELKEVLFNHKNYKKLIKERQDFMLVVGDGREVKILSGKKNKKVLSVYQKNILTFDSSVIKGVSASQGLVQGVVKVVLHYTDKISDGEILVASMTTPEYAPLMKKALAFITDEGGITCHAAIVAREMKKPCIIGTKIATKILKDGDFIEVDANQGVVKKIIK